MTAVTEQILDTAKRLGETSPHGRLCPPFLACLDELPSTAPIPTLSTRMANERALGLSFILAAQTWRQFVVCYGEDEARTIYGLSNNLVVFGGGKDIRFYQELSDLIGSTSHTETRYSARGHELFGVMDRSYDQRRVPILEPAELRRIEQRKALVLAEMYDPIIAHLHRCIDGKRGKELLAAQNVRLRGPRPRRGPRAHPPDGVRAHGADRDGVPDQAAARNAEVGEEQPMTTTHPSQLVARAAGGAAAPNGNGMMPLVGLMVHPFPEPGPTIRTAMEQLQQADGSSRQLMRKNCASSRRCLGPGIRPRAPG